jgi:hypothetical protein
MTACDAWGDLGTIGTSFGHAPAIACDAKRRFVAALGQLRSGSDLKRGCLAFDGAGSPLRELHAGPLWRFR